MRRSGLWTRTTAREIRLCCPPLKWATVSAANFFSPYKPRKRTCSSWPICRRAASPVGRSEIRIARRFHCRSCWISIRSAEGPPSPRIPPRAPRPAACTRWTSCAPFRAAAPTPRLHRSAASSFLPANWGGWSSRSRLLRGVRIYASEKLVFQYLYLSVRAKFTYIVPFITVMSRSSSTNFPFFAYCFRAPRTVTAASPSSIFVDPEKTEISNVLTAVDRMYAVNRKCPMENNRIRPMILSLLFMTIKSSQFPI